MNLIVSDRHLDLTGLEHIAFDWIDLSKLRIAACMGCFGCWVKTPGRCVIRDDAVTVYPRIAESRRLLYVSRVRYGCYDTPLKTMLERAIPVQQAFLRLHCGETHHVQRRVVPKEAVVMGYGTRTPEEREIFAQLVARNARNMSFASVRVLFPAEEDLEQAVRKEVLGWGAC